MARFEETALRECTFGSREGRQTVVVMGDSHAAQWFPALNDIALERNVRLVLLLKQGCPAAVLTVINVNTRKQYDECDLWREKAIARISEMRPAVVIVSQYQAYASEERRNQWPDPMAEWRDGHRRLFQKLEPSGARAVLLLDSPQPDQDIPVCLSRRARNGYFKNSSCDILRAAAFPNPEIAAGQQSAARAAGNADVIDMTPSFCDGSRCDAVRNGIIVYRDANHLTSSYTRYLKPILLSRLSPYLEPSDPD
jgi:hypothetical protein